MATKRVRITGLINEEASPHLIGEVFIVRQAVEVIADEWWEEKHKVPIGTPFFIYYCYEKLAGGFSHFAFYGDTAPEELQPNYSYEFLPEEEDKIV
jgi:hypothetical protein